MARPTEFEDLSDYDRRGPRVAVLESPPSPRKTLIHSLKTIESPDKGAADGLLDKTGDIEGNDEITHCLRPTGKDHERKLRDARYSWDRSYEKAAIDPGRMRWSVDDRAENENKPSVQWPAADEGAKI